MFRDILPNAVESKPTGNRALFWISILLAGIFLYLALRGLDWVAFKSVLRNMDYIYIPFIFLWGIISHWVRANRWRILLSAEKQIPAVKVFWANITGYLGNSIFPARAGELIRAIYVGKENELPVSFALATGLVERFIDLIALVIIGSISLASAGIVSVQLSGVLRIMTSIALVGLLGIILAPYVGHKLIDSLPAVPILKPSAREKVDGYLKQFLRGVDALHHPVRIVTFILFTCLIWAMDGVSTVILGLSLHLNITLVQSFLLLAGLGLSSAIPSTPGYVGVYQFVAVIVLQPFGISNTDALALIIFMQVMNLLLVAVWGWLGISRISRISDMKRRDTA